MANRDQYDTAVVAVANGTATREQQHLAAREAQQAGSRGNAARDAFQGRR